MKVKFENTVHIEGILYQHKLENKISGVNSQNPGIPFISGTIDIATDNKLANIVQVHFTYVVETTKKGKINQTWIVLQNIINGKYGCYVDVGADAVKIKIDNSSVALNEFYSEKTGKEELVSVKRNEGGFVKIVDTVIEDENQRATFRCDMLITNVIRMDEDPERNIVEHAIIKGAVFDDYRKSLLPLNFITINPNAINYFEGLEATDKTPVFTQIWGKQISTVTSKEIRIESAFGDDDIKIVKSSRKEYVITGALKNPYEWDDESTLTVKELNEMIANRNVYLATLKDFKANQVINKITPQVSSAIEEFKF